MVDWPLTGSPQESKARHLLNPSSLVAPWTAELITSAQVWHLCHLSPLEQVLLIAVWRMCQNSFSVYFVNYKEHYHSILIMLRLCCHCRKSLFLRRTFKTCCLHTRMTASWKLCVSAFYEFAKDLQRIFITRRGEIATICCLSLSTCENTCPGCVHSPASLPVCPVC